VSEQVQQELKVTDQGAERTVQKTPEAVKEGGVIAAQPNQEIHGKAFEQSHQNDKTLSEPDMIAINDGETVAEYKARVAQIQANRFGFFDSEAETQAKVFEKSAKQAMEPIPAVSPVLSEGPYNSTVKLNVQITNVPEVSEGIKPEELLQYTDTMMQSGAQAVRQIERHMTEPNAINNDMANIAAHFSQSPYQLNKDAQTLFGAVVDQIDHPMTADDRAKAAGNLMPMFFFEGNAAEPVHPETVQQLALESMSESELLALGIRRVGKETFDLHMPELPPELRSLDYQLASPELLEAMAAKGRTIAIATEGSEDLLRLERAGAQGSAFGDLITIKPNARKITALEEFLHGTQEKLGFFTREADIPFEISEIHVKDFMIRHSRMLGLETNDLKALQWLKEDAIERAHRAGFIWKE
jgi:hypothetical protein